MTTTKHPYHQNCHTGESSCSWCKYRRVLAKGEEPHPPLHAPLTPSDKARYVREIFVNFSKWELSTKCLGGFTQNQNEVFIALCGSEQVKPIVRVVAVSTRRLIWLWRTSMLVRRLQDHDWLG